MIGILTRLNTAQNYFPSIHSFRIYYFLEKIGTGKIFILEISLYFLFQNPTNIIQKKCNYEYPILN